MEQSNKRAYLFSFTVSGVKNIENDMTLQFYDLTKPRKIDLRNNIKAIYGTNGSGKTAIVLAVRLLKEFILNKDILSSRYEALSNIVNKKTNSFHLKASFGIYEANSRIVESVYSYETRIIKRDNSFVVEKEELSSCVDNTIGGAYKRLLWNEDGELKFGYIPSDVEKTIADKMKNTLKFNSMGSMFGFLFSELKEDKDRKEADFSKIGRLLSDLVIIFADGIGVYLDSFDIPSRDVYFDVVDEKSLYRQRIGALHTYSVRSDSEADFVGEKELPYYVNRLGKLDNFIKLFKPELKSIDLDKKLYSDVEGKEKVFICCKIFNYGSYSVPFEFESTGLKKITRLYDSLQNCIFGSVVFIDEFDANIHDVYLDKLISFMSKNAKGQLCFTTHNMSPIKLLKDKKHSIDFINDTQEVYAWKKGGRRNPSVLYPEGLIPGSPFNIETFDFFTVFDVPDDD